MAVGDFNSFNDFTCIATQDSNSFSAITNCLVGQVFGADYLFVGIVLILIFAFLAWKGRFPLSATLPLATVLAFALSVVSPVFFVLWLLSIVANGVMLVVGVVFTYAKK